LAVMANAAFPSTTIEMENVASAAQTLGLDVVKAEIRQSEDVASAFQALNASQALYVCTDSLVFINRVRLNDLALRARLPTIYGFRAYVETGGLMSLGADVTHLFRRAAEYADKVLRGTKPAEIPVEQPTKFDLVINLTTAKALGLSLPAPLLARADEVIE
jgi:putative tryptophan/tyrosine transport system substrate-binding protein